MHTTNYTNALILPAVDCRVVAKVPEKPGTIATQQYARLAEAPYRLTSDELLLAVTAERQGVPPDGLADLRAQLFATGQACLRASPLVKTYGWALHHDGQSRVALVDPGAAAFAALRDDPAVAKVPGMKSRR